MTRTTALLGAALLAAACAGERKDDAVSTTTDRGTTASPSSEASDAMGTTQVRLVSALPAAKNVDLASDDRVVFSAVPYKTVTPFRDVEGNVERFTLRAAGAAPNGENVLADNREAMTDGSRYTIVALPDDEGKGAQLRVLKDELGVDAGKAKIRVIHAAPNVGEVDVAMSGQTDLLFDDVEFGKEAGFKEVDPMSGTLQIRRDDDDKDAQGPASSNAGRLNLEAGRAYTVVITGANPKRPDFITFVDEPIAGTNADYAPRETVGAAGQRADDVVPPTADAQKAGTMDRDRAGSTDEGTAPTGGRSTTGKEPT
ncbi:MAG TPA: DUF4397 domain-containing protein [Gemmatimonadales bacterium]|nr:DUF4397 domain-containing protein [Gemmatimonadales bacterium]